MTANITIVDDSHRHELLGALNAVRAANGDGALTCAGTLPAGVAAPAAGITLRAADLDAAALHQRPAGAGDAGTSIHEPASRDRAEDLRGERSKLAGFTAGLALAAGDPSAIRWAWSLFLSNANAVNQAVEMSAPPGVNHGTLSSADRGILREEIVANAIGGKVSGDALKTPIGSTDIDVIGSAGQLIEVYGASEGWNAATISSFGNQLEKLERGVPRPALQRRLVKEGTPRRVTDMAKKKLGADNVVIYRIVER